MRTSFGPQPSATQGQRNDSQWGAGNWAYSKSPSASQPTPGQAQSIAPKSQGTPYPSYSVPQAKGGGATGGYEAYKQPAPFQAAPAQTPWGPSNDPFVERNSFINQINQQRMQNQLAFNTGGVTNPAAGLTPGIDYQKAMQQAGLGGGAPSMSPNYGDSLISRLNQTFGDITPAAQRMGMSDNPSLGQGLGYPSVQPQRQPVGLDSIYAPGTDISKLPFTDTMEPNPAYKPTPAPKTNGPTAPGNPIPPVIRDGGMQRYRWAQNNPADPQAATILQAGVPWSKPGDSTLGQQESPYQPFVNNQGQKFTGTMSFAPGTPQEYQNQAYTNYANKNGFYQPSGQTATQSAGQPLAGSPLRTMNLKSSAGASSQPQQNDPNAIPGAWQRSHAQQIASDGNQRWLASLKPADRRVYQLLQRN